MKSLARALARSVFRSESLVRRLERSAWVQTLARHLRLRELTNAVFARHPIIRTLSDSGVVYSVETFETLEVEKMYFGNSVYREIFRAQPPETFIDLGCNSGLFACFVADCAGGRSPRGLCVDANAKQVALAQKNVALNRWSDVHVLCGLVGDRHANNESTEFFIHITSLGSSQFASEVPKRGRPQDWERVIVPTLQIEPTWNHLFGPAQRCNCLKVDIEGSEMHLLRRETTLLDRVDSILLEWHSWATSRAEVVVFLEGHGFRLVRVIEDEATHGVLFLRR